LNTIVLTTHIPKKTVPRIKWDTLGEDLGYLHSEDYKFGLQLTQEDYFGNTATLPGQNTCTRLI